MKPTFFVTMTIAVCLMACASTAWPLTPTLTPIQPTLTATVMVVTATATLTAVPTDTPTPTFTPTQPPTKTPRPTRTTIPTESPIPSATPMATRVTTDSAILLDDNLDTVALSVAWSKDGHYLFVGTKDRGLVTYDVAQQQRLSLVGNDSQVQALALSPDGQTLAAGLGNDGSIRLLSVETGYLRQTLWPAHEGWVQVLAFSPDNKILASGGDDGQVILWNALTGEKRQQLFKGEGWVWGLAFTPNGRYLIAGFQDESKFRVWDTQTWTLSQTFDGDQAADLAFSPDGSKFVTAGGTFHEANLWEFSTGRQLFNLRETPSWTWAVAYHPNGRFVVSAGVGEVIIMWDVATGQPARELYTGPDFIQALAFSPDGTKLASVGSAIWLWDMTQP